MKDKLLFAELFGHAEPVEVTAPKVTPRPYQAEAVQNVFDAWKGGHRSVLVVLPTGCGKSVVFSDVVRQYLEEN